MKNPYRSNKCWPVYLETKRRKLLDKNYKLCIQTSKGIVLTEGDYYNTRDGKVVYLFDQTVMNTGEYPFYMRESGSGLVLGQINFEGNICVLISNHPHDIVSVHSRPSLTYSI